MWVTLVRHGSTDWNDVERFQGHSDIPLNEKGIEQARKAARKLALEEFDAVISSDLLRCRQTAEIICEGKSCPIVFDPRWREMSFGRREGMTWKEIEESGLSEDPSSDVEDIASVAERICESFYELYDRGCKNVLIVTHSGPIFAFIANFVPNPEKFVAEERPPGTVFQAMVIPALERP